jgi:hypothetical protein
LRLEGRNIRRSLFASVEIVCLLSVSLMLTGKLAQKHFEIKTQIAVSRGRNLIDFERKIYIRRSIRAVYVVPVHVWLCWLRFEKQENQKRISCNLSSEPWATTTTTTVWCRRRRRCRPMNLSDCPTRGLTHFLSSGKRKIPKQENIFFFVFFVFIFLSFAYISYCNDVIRIFIYSLLRV